MARAATKVATGPKKSPVGTKRGEAQKSAPAKRGAQKGRRQRQELEETESWLGALTTLARSPLGREILADVLEAAAATIRHRPQVISQAIETGMEAASSAAETTAETLQQATSALAAMTASLIPNFSAAPRSREEDASRGRGRRSGAAKKRR
jgi:hypothetical protein